MTPHHSLVRRYCAGIFLGGLLAVAALTPAAHFGWVVSDPLRFAVISLGVLLGEMLPITLPRRGSEEELTLSAAFTMALLLIGGLGPALLAQMIASIAQDVQSGKPSWRIRFNAGQYALSLIAAWLAVRALEVSPHLDLAHPFESRQLPAMLLGAVVFFLVNSGLVGIAVALYQGVAIRTYYRHDFQFSLVAGGIILLTAPIVLAAASYSVVIVPLCLAPVVAMHYAISQSAASEHQARHDPLTGLPNRTAFRDALAGSLAGHREAAVLLMDLDRFKEVNDTLGHRFGDLLLVQVAERVRETIGRRARIARLGGDEFALVAPGCGEIAGVALAESIAEALHRPFVLEDITVEAPASIGIALSPQDGPGPETLLQRADVAMYHAKSRGIDVALYDERYDTHSPAKLTLTAELRRAIDSPQITVWYQPQLDLAGGEIHCVEALVRWEHPRLGRLLPGEFIRMAEQANLIRPLTRRVVDLVIGQIADWRALGVDVSVAVNISPQVLVDPAFAGELLSALHRHSVPPTRLRLEVTESALMSDPQTSRSVLGELSELGVESSIDDFGTGYSSLSYLADLPVSEVKIDRAFVARMEPGTSGWIIVNSTIDLAHNLGKRAVAEGVEQPEMLTELTALGCDAVQGHAISPALPAAEATGWLLRHATPLRTAVGEPLA